MAFITLHPSTSMSRNAAAASRSWDDIEIPEYLTGLYCHPGDEERLRKFSIPANFRLRTGSTAAEQLRFHRSMGHITPPRLSILSGEAGHKPSSASHPDGEQVEAQKNKKSSKGRKMKFANHCRTDSTSSSASDGSGCGQFRRKSVDGPDGLQSSIPAALGALLPHAVTSLFGGPLPNESHSSHSLDASASGAHGSGVITPAGRFLACVGLSPARGRGNGEKSQSRHRSTTGSLSGLVNLLNHNHISANGNESPTSSTTSSRKLSTPEIRITSSVSTSTAGTTAGTSHHHHHYSSPTTSGGLPLSESHNSSLAAEIIPEDDILPSPS